MFLVDAGRAASRRSRNSVLAIGHALLWGMGKVIDLEHPELRCLCVDLDAAKAPLEADAAAAVGAGALRRNIAAVTKSHRSRFATGSVTSAGL